jgi:glycosyltransferase involved in cell wall biosynthesis
MSAHAVILLGSHNGERFLAEQLKSFSAQTHETWSLLVSDDRSTDMTREVVGQFSQACSGHNINLIEGPKQGFARNFFQLMEKADPTAEYFALSDQDDIWLPGKLQRAIEVLAPLPAEKPALYCGRSFLIDENGSRIGRSPHFSRPPSFGNALLQNIASGNTMVFNAAARRLAVEASVAGLPYHDWWLYLIISGAGGSVIYDPEPQVLYRQHGSNLIGNNAGMLSRSRRLMRLLYGNYPLWTCRENLLAPQILTRLSSENRSIIEDFIRMSQRGGLRSLALFKRHGIYRQEMLGEVPFALALLLGVLAERPG